MHAAGDNLGHSPSRCVLCTYLLLFSDKHQKLEPTGQPGAPGMPESGSINQHANVWLGILTDPWARSWVQHGFPLWWKDKAKPPPPREFRNRASTAAPRAHLFVTTTILALLAAGAVAKWPTRPTVVNPLSVVPKSNGKLRLVVDMQYVNEFLYCPKLKYEKLTDLANIVLPGALMATVDLKDGYWQMRMHPTSFEYLGFEWEGQYYAFQVLPFGLATAPWWPGALPYS